MNAKQILFYLYLLLMLISSFIALILYGKDKKKAKNGEMRIKEKDLLFLACYNGAIGSLIGRILFHHKTDKKYFSLVIYFSLLIQIAVLVFLAYLSFLKK